MNLEKQFKNVKYLANNEITTIAKLALKLDKPILIEGPPGTGKTSFASAIAKMYGVQLYRIQCYEGITAEQVIGEYNYQKQLIEIARKNEKDVFTEEYFIPRPLLQVLQNDQQSVLLIDEVDRADEEFEAFLLEALGEKQITIPELGTIKSKGASTIILTSNGSRELSGALRRRALYLAMDYPDRKREIQIVKLHIPEIEDKLAEKIVGIVRKVRKNEMITQAPSISETIDFAKSIMILGEEILDKNTLNQLLGILAKNVNDLQALRKMLDLGELV